MQASTCSLNAYAVVRLGCPVGFEVRDSDELEVAFGGTDRPLMLLFDAESFRAFLNEGAEALKRMEAHERTESD